MAEGECYATLLLSDSYLPGALVIAHSLRDAGSTKKLVVLVTTDTVSPEVIAELNAVYNHVIPVDRIRNDSPANLHLMGRPDLHSAFTKIQLWNQTQFSKIVYVDADVVALRAPEELFDFVAPFSAAPDIGWPDLFNTGVMVLTPNADDYNAMLAMAEQGTSFDGADQGLINMHFKNNYNRISFTYNVTPSAHYQYLPAYEHFKDTISMVHFIGSGKPWAQGKSATSYGNNPYTELANKWWSVYDRHYGKESTATKTAAGTSEFNVVQYFVRGEYKPTGNGELRTNGNGNGDGNGGDDRVHHPAQQQVPQEQHDSSCLENRQVDSASDHRRPPDAASHHQRQHFHEGTQAEALTEQVPGYYETGLPYNAMAWDAARYPPPRNSRPEAQNLPHRTYHMSRDTSQFVAPRYPNPPRNLWYNVPNQTAPQQVFPWEAQQPKPTRVFAGDEMLSQSQEQERLRARNDQREELDEGAKTPVAPSSPTTTAATSIPGSPMSRNEPATPTSPPSDTWNVYSRANAWDDVPEIERYVTGLQGSRGAKAAAQAGLPGVARPAEEDEEDAPPLRLRGVRQSDFSVDRPSLPVTPAPMRRPNFWGGGPGIADDDARLPAAQGVPAPSEWDPLAQLQKLASQQDDLMRKFELSGGNQAVSSGREIPQRTLPSGSEPATSSQAPAYFQQQFGDVLSPIPVKGDDTNVVRNMAEEEA